jgi:hypothetical protein
LARVNNAPLVSAGNLWMWRSQIRFEQRVKLGSAGELRAQVGVTQMREEGGVIPAQYSASLETRRPALEGNFRFSHSFDDFRRAEFAVGFHRSTTHVAGVGVPSSVLSFDWFWNPVRKFEFTGTMWHGENVGKHGGTASVPSLTFLTPRPGQLRVLPVRGRGGWAQLTWITTSRLSFNLFGGEHDTPKGDLAFVPTYRHRNVAYGANFFYRLATNVITGVETSQVRSWYLGGERPSNNHLDIYVAYLF